jgi:cell division septation protein DedD
MSHTPTRLLVAGTHGTAKYLLVAVATSALLSGCAIWPKALTFWGDPEPKPEVQVEAPIAKPATPEPAPEPKIVATAPTPAPTPVVLPAEPLPPLPPLPTPAAAATPGALAQGFYINVGLFAVPSNGSNAFKKLEGAGQPVFSDMIETKKGKLTRVRVGPFATRALADAAALKIRALKLDAVVFKQ